MLYRTNNYQTEVNSGLGFRPSPLGQTSRDAAARRAGILTKTLAAAIVGSEDVRPVRNQIGPVAYNRLLQLHAQLVDAIQHGRLGTTTATIVGDMAALLSQARPPEIQLRPTSFFALRR